MMYRKLVFLLVAGALVPEGMLQAKLNFPRTAVSVKATVADKSLHSNFQFTNDGKEPVDILSVTSSCGCTVASLDKNHYEPGESGALAVAYTIGINEGKQSQTVTVVTNEKTENSYELTFNADLPRGLRGGLPPAEPITPRLLYWTRKPFETKAVTVDLKTTSVSKLTVTCDKSADFKIETEEIAGKPTAQLKVTPNAGLGELRGELTVYLEMADGRRSQHKVFLRIAPEKRTASP
jgi:hypothetical protein